MEYSRKWVARKSTTNMAASMSSLGRQTEYFGKCEKTRSLPQASWSPFPPLTTLQRTTQI